MRHEENADAAKGCQGFQHQNSGGNGDENHAKDDGGAGTAGKRQARLRVEHRAVYGNEMGQGIDMAKVGRPADERRQLMKTKYGLNEVHLRRRLTATSMDQLDRCPTEEARKLLLGIVEKDA